MGRQARIRLEGVSKSFNLGGKDKSALEIFLDFMKKNRNKRIVSVLEDISFEVKPGENMGIIGKNGSGKSSLLRIISGIYKMDSGKIYTKGEMVYLTGFGHGLQPKLTMKENIFLVGSIMGLGQKEIKERFDKIVEFSGLRDYVDTKLFKFSSGMRTRLASSIGLHCVSHRKPDILLVDEVVGGGADKDYRKKSLKKMEELLKGGSSVILVSHQTEAIRKHCDKVIWLDKGKIRMQGTPEEIVKKYLSN